MESLRRPYSTKSEFGAWMAQQRYQRKLSRKDLGALIFCNARTVEAIEQGRRRLHPPSDELLLRTFAIPRREWAAYLAWMKGTGPRPANAEVPSVGARTQPLSQPPPISEAATRRLDPEDAEEPMPIFEGVPLRPPGPSRRREDPTGDPLHCEGNLRRWMWDEALKIKAFYNLLGLAHWRMRAFVLILIICCLLLARWPGWTTDGVVAASMLIGLFLLRPWFTLQALCGVSWQLALVRVGGLSLMILLDAATILPDWLPR